MYAAPILICTDPHSQLYKQANCCQGNALISWLGHKTVVRRPACKATSEHLPQQHVLTCMRVQISSFPGILGMCKRRDTLSSQSCKQQGSLVTCAIVIRGHIKGPNVMTTCYARLCLALMSLITDQVMLHNARSRHLVCASICNGQKYLHSDKEG